MKRDEAILLAQEFVKDRYSLVPVVGTVLHCTESQIRVYELWNGPISMEERKAFFGKWMVCFKSTWETVEVGIPEPLIVLVDNRTTMAELW